jgi:iron complex outermembrane receptor protein
MDNSLNLAMQKLKDGGFTCVVIHQNGVYTSFDRGVKPLIELFEKQGKLSGAVAADKVVGMGAAHLYILLGVKALFASVISKGAYELLVGTGICVFCDKTVPFIINRKGDGMCPIESAVKDAVDSDEAYKLIKNRLKSLER